MIFPNFSELIKLKNVVAQTTFMQKNTNNNMHGNYTSLFHGLGVEFETVRPYVIGDDVRYIDWRVSARSGATHVKTFRAECDRNVMIAVDANAYMRFGTRNTFKSIQAAKVAALLAWKSLQLRDRVGRFVFGYVADGIQFFNPTKHDSATLRLLKNLCSENIDLHPPVTPSTALQQATKILTSQTLLFIISDFSMDNLDELKRTLLNIRKKCNVVLLPVYDPADSVIPAIGSIIFSNNHANSMINTNNTKAAEIYKSKWNEYSKNIEYLSKTLKSPLVWVTTDTEPHLALRNTLSISNG